MRGDKIELCALYCRRFPNLASRGVAREIIKDNPEVFANLENARTTVRDVRGQNGVRNRLTNVDEFKDIREKFAFDIPIAEPFNTTPFDITDSRLLILADIHAPFHEPGILDIAIKEGKKRGINAILLNGDTADAYRCSYFMRQPGLALFQREKFCLVEILDLLRRKFPKAPIYWKMGNHDDRLPHYIYQNAPDLFDPDSKALTWESFLDVADMGVNWIDSWRKIYYGKLCIVHGHEFGGGGIGSVSSVNPARGLFLQTKSVALAAHSHQSSIHNEPDIRGRLLTCWSMGCMCQLAARYRPVTKWNHGFVVAALKDGEGNFSVDNYRVLPSGELVT
jgi:predicted phosphodiesterase